VSTPEPAPAGPPVTLLLRLAGPLQSWGDRSAFNRRDTRPEPTKSGIVGLLAAAQGRPRSADLADLASLDLGVRVDCAGSLLRDYHTVSDFRGTPLPAAAVNAKGLQKPTSPAKYTHVTHRYYLQDAVFLAAISGPTALLETLAHALTHPAYALALGRRSCPPTQPLLLGLRTLPLQAALEAEPWQATEPIRKTWGRHNSNAAGIDLPATLDDHTGAHTADDLPLSFRPGHRAFTSRRVRHTYLHVPTGLTPAPNTSTTTGPAAGHDPFALLGG